MPSLYLRRRGTGVTEGARKQVEVIRIPSDSPHYSLVLRERLGDDAPEALEAMGDLALLRAPLLALFCSVRCPGRLILQTYDTAVALREAGAAVIGGFHSPMEKECLMLLLRGTQPVVLCPARSLEGMRIPREYRAPLAEGRLLLLSPFEEKQRRADTGSAWARNRFVAASAAEVFVSHAAPGGKMEQLCREIAASGRPLIALDSPHNACLLYTSPSPRDS